MVDIVELIRVIKLLLHFKPLLLNNFWVLVELFDLVYKLLPFCILGVFYLLNILLIVLLNVYSFAELALDDLRLLAFQALFSKHCGYLFLINV